MASIIDHWQLAITVIGGLAAVVAVLFIAVKAWAISTYQELLNSPKTQCDVDEFVGEKNKVNAVKVSLMHKLRLGNRKVSDKPIPLELFSSPHIPGLRVSRLAGDTAPADDVISLEKFLDDSKSGKKPIVVATIRMGFGHHRLAYSAVSWALSQGHPTVFHDLLNIKSPEADLLVSTDNLYSYFSRISSEIGGFVEKTWGNMMLSGDPDALRAAYLTSLQLMPLLQAYPKDTPIISTHQLVTLTASACGFTNIINLVIDNHAQWFLVVPKSMNIVQGPVNYQNFLKMGVSTKELGYGGHWCPVDLVENIETDCNRRIERAKAGFGDSKDSIKPRRFLIPVGGAGAQRKFIVNMVHSLSTLVKNGRVQLFLNAGDHAHMKSAFLKALADCKLDYDTVTTLDGVRKLQETLLDPSKEPSKPVTLFSYDEYFPAVATTDIMSRVSDVLSCKPSELAFYPLPKLHIRRVGNHEAFSATRAAELGDGSIEAREVEDAMDYINLFLNAPDLLVHMNESVIRNNKIGLYDGCKKAVALAVEEK